MWAVTRWIVAWAVAAVWSNEFQPTKNANWMSGMRAQGHKRKRRAGPDGEQGARHPALGRVVDCFRDEGDGAVVAVERALVVAEADAETGAENDLQLCVEEVGREEVRGPLTQKANRTDTARGAILVLIRMVLRTRGSCITERQGAVDSK